MRFKVYLLRRRGRRLARRDWVNGPHHIGNLVTHTIEVAGERYNVATLRGIDPVSPDLVPRLYEPVLLGFAPLAFRLRGFETVESDGGFAVVQEWHCELP